MKKLFFKFSVCCLLLNFLLLQNTYFSFENKALHFFKSNVTKVVASNDDTIFYGRILNENTPFYSDHTLKTIKFILPYSYFVKVVSVSENYAHVIYMDDEQTIPGQSGYIEKKDLFLFDKIPENPYPKVFLQLKCDEILFSDTTLSLPKTILSAQQTAIFYGSIFENGENFYYVYSNGFIGYVRKSSFVKTIIPDHPLPIEVSKEEDSSPAAKESVENSLLEVPESNQIDNFKIIILVISGIVALCIIYILFRPKKQSFKTAATTDDDDQF